MKHTIPNLPHYCGSWIVTSKETGEAVLETFEKKTAQLINQEKYNVLTADQYLANINKENKNA